MQNNKCEIANHDQTKIKSICFHRQCQQKGIYCQLCLTEFHQDHLDQSIQLDQALEYIETQSKKLVTPELKQALLELDQIYNYLGELQNLIIQEKERLQSQNIQQVCKDIGSRYNLLGAQDLQNQRWSLLSLEMLRIFQVQNGNIILKDCYLNQFSKSYLQFISQLQNTVKKILQEFQLNLEIIDERSEKINFFECFNEKQLLTGHTNIVRGVDICKERNLLATGSADNTMKLWNLEDNVAIKTYKYSGQVLDVVFSNNGNLLAFCGGGNYSLNLIDISDLNQDNIVTELCAHKHMINQIIFSNNSKYLISGSFDKTLRIWNIKSKIEAFKSESEGSVNGVAISADDTLIASNSDDGKISILQFPNCKILCSQSSNQRGSGIQFSHDSQILVSSDEKGSIKVWSLVKIHQRKLQLVKRFNAATQCIWTVLLSSCFRFIIFICNEDSEIKVISSQTGEVVKLFISKQKNNYQMIDVAISKDMDIIAYGEDNNIVVWRKN